jgi:molybdopterin molybdotransferase
MISVIEAKKLIEENCEPSRIILTPLLEACGSILAESIFSPIDTPPFDQSAMDGFAFSFDGWNGKNELFVTEEIQAGSFSNNTLKPGHAVRIFTGAPVPKGADSVVMQEKVVINGQYISIDDQMLSKGANVRLSGSQTKKGAIVLEAGVLITPAAVSLIAGIGIADVNVFAKPKINIIVTGNELVKPGHPISEGQIYESNSYGLMAALSQLGIIPDSVVMVGDEEDETIDKIMSQLKCDILILTGGVSMGNYDFVTSALDKCGVTKVFHKVKQKPGKPLFFGKKGSTLVFGLPGNPAAVMTCFYEYIVPVISRFTRKKYYKSLQLTLAQSYGKKPGLTHFLKGKTNESYVTILPGQESYLMNSFAVADCVVELEEEKEHFNAGESVVAKMIVR